MCPLFSDEESRYERTTNGGQIRCETNGSFSSDDGEAELGEANEESADEENSVEAPGDGAPGVPAGESSTGLSSDAPPLSSGVNDAEEKKEDSDRDKNKVSFFVAWEV